MTHAPENRIKHSHRLQAEAVLRDNDTWDLLGVTYRNLPCGCAPTGGGVFPSPLTVTLCPLHRATPEIIKALKDLLDANRNSFDGLASWMDLWDEAETVLALIEKETPL